MSGLGVSVIYSDIIFGIWRASYPWCETFIEFCPAIAGIMELIDAKKSRYRNVNNIRNSFEKMTAKYESYLT